MSVDLTPHILKALEGTSGQKPVHIEALSKVADKLCDDPNDLYNLLEKLYAERVVNRCAGMKEGNPYLAYWLTGAVPPPVPFRVVQEPRVHLVRRIEPQPSQKVQPKTAEPSPTQTQEPPMGKRPETSAGLSQLIADIVNQHAAGLTLEELHSKITKTMPTITVKQVFDITYYLHGQHKIVRDGKGKAAKLLPGTGQPEAKLRQSKPRAVAAAAAPVARKKDTAPPQDGLALQAIFRLDGTLTISKGDAVLELDASESARLARFAAQINLPAENIALA